MIHIARPGAPSGGLSQNGVTIRRRWLALAVIVAGLLIAGAWLLGDQMASSPAVHASHRSAARARSGMIAFQDPHRLFAAGYPASWHRLVASEPEVVLLARGSDGGSLLVRETPLDGSVTAANLTAGRALADRVVHSGNNVILLRQPQQVTLGGLPGYLYLYSFFDPASGKRGAHAHYFLFDDRTMITLVFQAMPAVRIFALSKLFDRIAGTFHAVSSAGGTITSYP